MRRKPQGKVPVVAHHTDEMVEGAASAVSLSGARHAFGARQVLSGASLVLHSGEIYGLLGPNGAGKTTLMKAISGRLKLDRGSAALNGQATSESSELLRKVAVVPQEISLYRHLTVLENLRVFGKTSGLSRGALHDKISGLIEEAKLEDRVGQICGTLSGGYQRRVNVCAALLQSPSVLLLDEPTVGIDIDAREAIHDLLFALRRNGVAIMISTHDFGQAQGLCDRVGILLGGKIEVEGKPADLLHETFNTLQQVTADLLVVPNEAQLAYMQSLGFGKTPTANCWISYRDADDINPATLGQRLSAHGLKVKEIRIQAPDLASLFSLVMQGEAAE